MRESKKQNKNNQKKKQTNQKIPHQNKNETKKWWVRKLLKRSEQRK